jgi:hypothetical protein
MGPSMATQYSLDRLMSTNCRVSGPSHTVQKTENITVHVVTTGWPLAIHPWLAGGMGCLVILG